MALSLGSSVAPMAAMGLLHNNNNNNNNSNPHHESYFLTPSITISNSSNNSKCFNCSHQKKPLQVGAFGPSRTFGNTVVAAAAVSTDQISSSSDSAQQASKTKYYFLVANAKFMLDEEEHFQEQLFERLRFFGERGRGQDFWLVIEPKFLDKFPDITKRLGRPAVALVSTDRIWITFMKLRLDRVLADSYEASSVEEALSCTPVNIEFKKPANWVAPYPKYESGWWKTFLPAKSSSPDV